MGFGRIHKWTWVKNISFCHYFKVLPCAHQSKVAVCKVFRLVSGERCLEGKRCKKKCLIFLGSVSFPPPPSSGPQEDDSCCPENQGDRSHSDDALHGGGGGGVRPRGHHGVRAATVGSMQQQGFLLQPHLPEPITMGFMKRSPWSHQQYNLGRNRRWDTNGFTLTSLFSPPSPADVLAPFSTWRTSLVKVIYWKLKSWTQSTLIFSMLRFWGFSRVQPVRSGNYKMWDEWWFQHYLVPKNVPRHRISAGEAQTAQNLYMGIWFDNVTTSNPAAIPAAKHPSIQLIVWQKLLIPEAQYRARITFSSFSSRFPSFLVYKVPMEDALPLSQSFSKLEEGKSKTRWVFWKGGMPTANFQLSSHFSTAKRNFNVEEYSFSLNTLAQARDFKARHAIKAWAGTKATERPGPVQWQKAAPPKNFLGLAGEGSSTGKVVKNGLVLSTAGFSMVGISLGKVLLPDSTHLRQAHSASGDGCPWQMSSLYGCSWSSRLLLFVQGWWQRWGIFMSIHWWVKPLWIHLWAASASQQVTPESTGVSATAYVLPTYSYFTYLS